MDSAFSANPCRQAAVKGKHVCRMHGASGGAPKGNKNRIVHGCYTAEAKAELLAARMIFRAMREAGD